MMVGGQNIVFSAKRADQHEQGRLRKVKIREKSVDDFEVVSGINKEIGLARARENIAGVLTGSKLKGADSGGAHSDDASRLTARLADFPGGGFADRVDLGMKVVFFHPLGADGLKGPKADVECNLGSFNSMGSDAGKDFGSEVKARGRRRDGSKRASIHGLIAVAIRGGIFAGDVGGEGDVPDLVDANEKIIDGIKADTAFSKGSAGEHLGAEFVVVAEEEMFANVDLAARTDKAFPFIGILLELASKENFDASLKKIARGRIVRTQLLGLESRTVSVKARGKHSRVVEDEQVIGLEKIGEIAKLPVQKLPGGGGKMKQARVRAIGQRLLRDQFGREIVIEIGNEHAIRL